MKSRLNRKILRIASVEILLQLGFERCTEESLNILTEVFEYYIDALCRNVFLGNTIDMNPEADNNTSANSRSLLSTESKFKSPDEVNSSDFTICRLLEIFYGDFQYNFSEIIEFASQQTNMLTHIVSNNNSTNDSAAVSYDSMLSALKFLPRSQSLSSLYKSTKKTNLKILMDEETKKFSEVAVGDVELDNYLREFIRNTRIKYSQVENMKHRTYSFDLGKAFSDFNPGTYERNPLVMNTREKEEQETFITEFGAIKKKMLKKRYQKKHPLGSE